MHSLLISCRKQRHGCIRRTIPSIYEQCIRQDKNQKMAVKNHQTHQKCPKQWFSVFHFCQSITLSNLLIWLFAIPYFKIHLITLKSKPKTLNFDFILNSFTKKSRLRHARLALWLFRRTRACKLHAAPPRRAKHVVLRVVDAHVYGGIRKLERR